MKGSNKRRKYDVIYADPPWQFKVWSNKGAGRSAEIHYNTQSINFLKDMNIQALCNPNCVLLMWVTFPCLEQGLELGRAWGFTYKTVAFTWVKSNRNNANPFVGMGYYTRSNAEIVLLFTKGKTLERKAKDVPQVLVSPRGRHSEKPDEIRKRIVRLFGDVPRLELFARQNSSETTENIFDGWDLFGNEVDNSIEIP
ncbi:DNA methyltransferase [Flavobacterium psychroterrae]|uniref:DNA methyltransferase n=1 Tax=Flavobacterium psychroterrae TaxID=2133767 RepID=A0ABS5PG86_9FLAO|nr:MT-A70 family methyltransferase [Flavobacterium psychroterrae]MBS7233146.1 DNA methyltransferase [Flavobacterium psychroterrae]